MMGRWTLDTSPAYIAMDLMSRLLSPYDLNPLAYNPLRKILVKCIDFERLARSPIKLFVTATSVRTGRGRIFRNADITADVLLASACLPTMFRAIEIGGEPYWDGGYAGNPTITPLIRESDAHDTILVQINPRERPDTPRSASEILNRLNEISFNSPLMKELRMIALLRQVADPGSGEGALGEHARAPGRHRHAGASAPPRSSMPEWEFCHHAVRRRPHARPTIFSKTNGEHLGKRSTADLDVSAERVLSDGTARHPLVGSASGLARVPRLERAGAGAGRGFGRRRLWPRAAARQLDANLHGQRRVLSWRNSFRCFCSARCSAS